MLKPIQLVGLLVRSVGVGSESLSAQVKYQKWVLVR